MLKNKIIAILKTIPDPELNISIWDLGLIYDIKIDKKGIVAVVMTLTTIGCPLFSLISDPVKEKIGKIRGIKSVEVELTFDPPWSMDRMSPEAKLQLGLT